MKAKTIIKGCFILLLILGFVGMYQKHDCLKNALSKIAGAGCGPCLAREACGFAAGMGNCSWTGDSCGNTRCGVGCPGSAQNEYCGGYGTDDCTATSVVCGQMIRSKCSPNAYEPVCLCDAASGNPTNGFCSRNDC